MESEYAVARILAQHRSKEVKALLEDPERFLELLREQVEVPEPSVSLDSQEAAEEVDVEEQTWEGATSVWKRLDLEQRQRLLELAKTIGADTEDLEFELNQRLPL